MPLAGLLFRFLGSRAAEGLVDSGIRFLETRSPNAEKLSRRRMDSVTSARELSARGFMPPENGFDSFVNGMKNLMVPLITVMGFTLFGALVFLAKEDPAEFEAWMAALAAIPDEIWYIVIAIITFHLGDVGMDKIRRGRVEREASRGLAQVAQRQAEMRHERKMARKPVEGDK